MADKDSFSFDIKTSVGVISESSKGWTKELNFVSWNGRKAKYDIRERECIQGNGLHVPLGCGYDRTCAALCAADSAKV